MTYRWLRDLHTVARGANLRVTEIPGWQDRGRPESVGGFDPVGVMVHHTGGVSDGLPYARWLALTGRPAEDIPAPLAQLALSRKGVVYVLAAGRANHAGEVIGYGGWLTAGDGNAQTVGIEAMNDGSEGWSDDQYDAYVRLCAALCEAYGWPTDRIVAHKEAAPDRKVDPGKMDMRRFRRSVAIVRGVLDGGGTMPDNDDVVHDVWAKGIRPILDGTEGESIPASRMLSQTHNRADDARVAAQALRPILVATRENVAKARQAAEAGADRVETLGARIERAEGATVDARAAANAARVAAERAATAAESIVSGSWTLEPDNDGQDAVRDAVKAAAGGAPVLHVPAAPGARGLSVPQSSSTRPREYRKATTGAGFGAAVTAVFALWRADWDLDAITEQDVTSLLALVAVVFPTVFGVANLKPGDLTRREQRRWRKLHEPAKTKRRGQRDVLND